MIRLLVPAGSPWWLFATADLILFLHIAGGSVAIVSGAVALLAPKGETLHRWSGAIFFVSMLIMATIGAVASPFLPVPQLANVAAGTLTLYLVVTSWVTIRRKGHGIGRGDTVGLAVVMAVIAAGVSFMLMARASPTGTIGNTPPQAFIVFVLIGTLAAAGDLRMIVRKRISRPARIARHLWRMCAALFIASGSFFLGQQQVMPAFMRGSPWLFVPVIAPLLWMITWLARIRFTRRFNVDPLAERAIEPHVLPEKS